MVVTLGLLAGCSSATPTASADQTEASNAPKVGKDIEKDPLKIAFIPLSTSGVASALELKAIEDQLLYYKNAKLQVFDPQFDPSKQVTMIQECITQKYDGILIEPMDPETVGKAIVEAEMAGIPVCTINPQVSQPHAFGIKGSDYMSGEIAAEYLCKAFNDKANVVILDAPAAQMASVMYSKGFNDYLAANNKTEMVVIDYQNIDNWSLDIANQAMRDLLTKHSDIDAVFCASDDLALGAVQAVNSAGRADEIKVWGAGGFPNALKAIQDGIMYGTSFQDYYTELSAATYLLLNHIQTGKTAITEGYSETPIVQCPAFPCTKENMDIIIAQSRQAEIK